MLVWEYKLDLVLFLFFPQEKIQFFFMNIFMYYITHVVSSAVDVMYTMQSSILSLRSKLKM